MKDGADLFDVVQASIYGAAKGDQIGREIGQTLAGASVETRIRWAVNIAMNAKNLDEAINEIEDYIGSGLMTVEAVPAVIGLCVAAKGMRWTASARRSISVTIPIPWRRWLAVFWALCMARTLSRSTILR